jgi:hypothetical protein
MYLKNYLLLILALMLVLTPVMAQKQCVAGSEYIHIISQDNYAIGEPVNDITLEIANSLIDSTNGQIIARLCSGNPCTTSNELKRVSPSLSLTTHKALFDFGYSSTKSASLYIVISVGDPNGVHYSTSKQINIMKTLLIKPICTPLQAFTNREVTCSWDIVDVDTNQLVSGTSSLCIVKQGSTELFNGYCSGNTKFTPPKSGSVDVTITSSKTGFISDTQNVLVDVQDVSRTQTFLLDNLDFFTYSNSGGIKTGTHQIELKIDESGIPIDVQTINANIITPSSQTVTIIFNKAGTGDYKAVYNFAQAGQVYILKGEILFTDISKENILFEYRINTASSTTEDIGGQTNLLIVGGIVSFAITVIIVILIIVFRRKR